MYSMTAFTAILLLNIKGVTYSNYQYIYIDFIIAAPTALFMGFTKPKDKLQKERPPGTLLTPTVILYLLLFFGIEFGAEAFIYKLV